MPFEAGPCAGAEECLPSVGACQTSDGRTVPDHGDFWRLPWTVDDYETRSIRMHALGFSRPFRFERHLTLEGKTLTLRYRITNFGDRTETFLYAWHPLFAFDEGDRIVLSPEVDVLQLDYSHSELLGKRGDVIAWPIHQSRRGECIDLSLLRSSTAGTADMLYTNRLRRGVCGLYRSLSRQGLIVRFNADCLPYLGLWICHGGWPPSGQNLQVAVALEPTVAPYNTLKEAEDVARAPQISPGESFDWTISIEVTHPGLSLAEVSAQMLT